MLGIFPQYNGRYNICEEITTHNKHREHTPLKENERFVSILWAGGWDEYVVDISTIREENEKEQNAKYSPTVDGYLRGKFGKKICQPNQSVKILRHLAGGD